MVKDREEEVVEAENEVWTQIKQILQSFSEGRKLGRPALFYKWPPEPIDSEHRQCPKT